MKTIRAAVKQNHPREVRQECESRVKNGISSQSWGWRLEETCSCCLSKCLSDPFLLIVGPSMAECTTPLRVRGASGEEEKKGGGDIVVTQQTTVFLCYVTASDLFFFHQSEMDKVLTGRKREPLLFSIAKCFFFKPGRVWLRERPGLKLKALKCTRIFRKTKLAWWKCTVYIVQGVIKTLR